MGAGLINIVSYGANELYLTGNAQITFFKSVYRRYTNFSSQNYSFDLNGLEFGKENEFVIPKVADLLGKICLQINLPMFSISRSDIGMDQQDITTALTNYTTSKNNYNTILDFMVLNTDCYLAAYNTSLAINSNVTNIQNSIVTAKTTYDTIYGTSLTQNSTTLESTYINLLNTYYTTPPQWFIDANSQNIFPQWFLAYKFSDLLALYANSYSNVVAIMAYLNICMETSLKVQKFFYDDMKIKLNILLDMMSPNAKMAYVQNLAFSIIDYISFYISGEEIDKHDGDWLNVWYQLNGNPNQKEIFDSLIGNSLTLTEFDRNTKPSYNLTLPLSFFFCKNIGLSLPLIALQNSDARLLLKLKRIEECIYVEKNPNLPNNVGINLFDIWQNNGFSLSGNYLIDYYFLDKTERKRFAQSAHEYLIETVQLEGRDNVSHDEPIVKQEMTFTGACKELIWFFQKNAYIENTTNNYNSMWWNYGINGNGSGNILKYGEIRFGTYRRVEKIKSDYFNLIQPYGKHTNYQYDGLYMYSFCLYPEDYQPSGECPIGRINSVYINFYIDKNAFYYFEGDILPGGDTTTKLLTTLRYNLYSLRYTVLRIIGGFGSLAFQ